MGSSSQKKEFIDSVRPVTLRQVNQASFSPSEDELKIDDKPVGKISIVATIRKVTGGENNAPMVYRLEDGTGTFEVRRFKTGSSVIPGEDEEMDQQEEAEFKEGQTVKVVGTLKNTNDKQVITAVGMIPVTDFNQVIYHQLYSLQVHLSNTRGEPGSNGAIGGGDSHNADSGSLYMPPGDAANDMQAKILNVLRSEKQNNPDGVHSDKIIVKIDENARQEILRELENMQEDGKIYSGEENHYLIAE
jgi:replication factor A2